MKKHFVPLFFIFNFSFLIPLTGLAQTSPSPVSGPQLVVTLLNQLDTTGLSDMDRMALPRRVIVNLNAPGLMPDLQVRLGSQPGLSDIGLRQFAAGVMGALPNGTSVAHTDGQLTLDLGTFTEAGHFHLTVSAPGSAPLSLTYSEFQ